MNHDYLVKYRRNDYSVAMLVWGEIEVQKVLTSQLYIVGGSLIGGKCPMHWPEQKMDGGVGQGRNINDEI